MTSAAIKLVDHFFRHEYGRLVAVLTQRLGLRHIDLAEDVAQSALASALQHWSRHGIPSNPGGWLFRTATNAAIDILRHESMSVRRLEKLHSELSRSSASLGAEHVSLENELFEDEINDDQIQLLLACCHPQLSASLSIALSLKTIGGFSVAEIGHALLTSEANIQKRITRAKEKLRECSMEPGFEPINDFASRLDAALMVIYLIFNEGYLSSHTEVSIRRDLCDEARRLATILAQHPLGALPKVFALLALMSFHIARLDARTDSSGDVMLLEYQDRSKWNWRDIREGMDWMQRATTGCELSRFHIEAAIAWEHCRAAQFQDTDWAKICKLYDTLLLQMPSPIQWLNRAIAESYFASPKIGLEMLNNIPLEQHPKQYPIWHAVLGYLHERNGDTENAKAHWLEALRCTHSRAEQDLLRKRIEMCMSRLNETQGDAFGRK